MPKYPLPMLSSLRAFEATARHQSVKRACAELHVTPSAVSRHVRKLERDVGRQLFVRHHRQISLTDDGEMLFGAVSLGLSHIQGAVEQLSRKRNPARLVISVDPDFARLWLVPRLRELYPVVPDSFVEIRAENGSNSLDDPRIDCAIHYSEAGKDIPHGEILFRSRLFPVCAPGLTQRLPLRYPEDLSNHVLLHDRTQDEWQEYLRNCPTTVNLNVSKGSIFNETALCLEAAVRGQGVAMGDDFLAAIHLTEGSLVRPFDSSFLSKNAYYFVVSERAPKHPAVDAFRTWLIHSIHDSRNGPGILRGRRKGARDGPNCRA